MPQFEKAVETPVTKQREDGIEKLPVPVWFYDVMLGPTQGTIYACMCALLNPLDKKNVELVMSKKLDQPEPEKLIADPKKSAGEQRARPTASAVQNALVPIKETTKANYRWQTWYQSFKNMFPNQPWGGALYGIRTNIPRNAAVFTTLPWLRDELEKSFTPEQSKVIAGAGTGLVESFVTARSRVIRTIMHTSKDNLTHKQVWEALHVRVRRKKISAAIKWGVAKGGIYWTAFPVLTQLCEAQINKSIDYFKFDDSYAVKAASYMFAGAVAGTVTPLISYPFDALGKRAILKTSQNQIQKTWNHYCSYGLLDTIKYNTHVGFLTTALPRMIISSAFFNLTLHMAKSACNAVFVVDEYHHEPSVASPALSSPAQLSNSPLPVVASSVVNPPAPERPPFSSPLNQPAMFFSPLAQQLKASKHVAQVPSVPVESVKPKV